MSLLGLALVERAASKNERRDPLMELIKRPAQDRRISDALSQARHRLSVSGYPEVRRLSCEADGRKLRLWGCVSRFHFKQVAQHLLRDLNGFDSVENLVTVAANYRDAS